MNIKKTNSYSLSDWFHGKSSSISRKRAGSKLTATNQAGAPVIHVNNILNTNHSARGDLPVGVRKRNDRYSAQLKVAGKLRHIGYFNTPEEAFQAYKATKEARLKDIAKSNRANLSQQDYDKLMHHTVSIDD